MNVQTVYQETIQFAAAKHLHQIMPDTQLPYMVHVCNVAMEILVAAVQSPTFDASFAVRTALLHDTLEDTDASFEELEQHFGNNVAMAVLALTKNELLSKEEAIPDSIARIKQLQKEVWLVKLADRITNLQAPAKEEDDAERRRYQQESRFILQELGEVNYFLAERLSEKIEAYNQYIL